MDTQVIAYATLRGPHAELARAVSARDSDWAAPSLWRSEFLNVLAGEMRRGAIALEAAIGFVADAAALVSTEAASDAAAVLTLADASRCTAYDLEFVAVAQALGVRLVTNDRQILDGFPAIAVSLQSFAGRSA